MQIAVDSPQKIEMRDWVVTIGHDSGYRYKTTYRSIDRGGALSFQRQLIRLMMQDPKFSGMSAAGWWGGCVPSSK